MTVAFVDEQELPALDFKWYVAATGWLPFDMEKCSCCGGRGYMFDYCCFTDGCLCLGEPVNTVECQFCNHAATNDEMIQAHIDGDVGEFTDAVQRIYRKVITGGSDE